MHEALEIYLTVFTHLAAISTQLSVSLVWWIWKVKTKLDLINNIVWFSMLFDWITIPTKTNFRNTSNVLFNAHPFILVFSYKILSVFVVNLTFLTIILIMILGFPRTSKHAEIIRQYFIISFLFNFERWLAQNQYEDI